MRAPDAPGRRDSRRHGGFLRRLRWLFPGKERAPVPVISIGSMVAGGVGRVPLIRAVVRRLTAQDDRPYILTNGEGGRLKGPIRVDPLQHTVRDVGDAAMRLAADAPVWIARDLRAGVRAAAEAKAGIIVIDNGLRTTSFVRDLTLLAIDADPQGANLQLPPVAVWSELPDGLGSADAVVLIGEGSGEPLQSLARASNLSVSRVEVLALNVAELAGRRLVAFAGVAQPEKAFKLLRETGADLVHEMPFPERHIYSQADWDHLVGLAENAGAELVTTERDAVRLPEEWRRRAWVMKIELRFIVESDLDQLLAQAKAAAGA